MSIHARENLKWVIFTLTHFCCRIASDFDQRLQSLKTCCSFHFMWFYWSVASKTFQKNSFNFIALNFFERNNTFINFDMTMSCSNKLNCDQYFFFCFEHFWIFLIFQSSYNFTLFFSSYNFTSFFSSYNFTFGCHFKAHTSLISFFYLILFLSHLLFIQFISFLFLLRKLIHNLSYNFIFGRHFRAHINLISLHIQFSPYILLISHIIHLIYYSSHILLTSFTIFISFLT